MLTPGLGFVVVHHKTNGGYEDKGGRLRYALFPPSPPVAGHACDADAEQDEARGFGDLLQQVTAHAHGKVHALPTSVERITSCLVRSLSKSYSKEGTVEKGVVIVARRRANCVFARGRGDKSAFPAGVDCRNCQPVRPWSQIDV